MKKLFLLLFTIISLNYHSQNGLTNLGFENWTFNLMGFAPTGWFGVGLSKQSNGAQEGNSYVRIVSDSLSSGTLLLGGVTSFTGSFSGGAPFTNLPTSIGGFYKSTGINTSTATALMNAYTKTNGQMSMMSLHTFSADASTWTSFSEAFSPINGNAVSSDSMFVVFLSGGFNSGIILDLDNIDIQSTDVTGIDKQSIGTSFLVYPNPAQNELNITSKNESAVNLTLTSIDGKTLISEKLNEGRNKINLENYPAGVYFYQILDKDRNILFKSKVVVEK